MWRFYVVNLPQFATLAFKCHMSAEYEHQVNFSTTAAAHQRLMRDRYAEEKGGARIDD